MPTCKVPTEVWIYIISLLRNPIPPPLSKPPRTAIRQQNLANVARVSKLFQDIAETLLYKDVVTDRLWELCSEIGKNTKLAKLKLIHTLRLEYDAKDADFSYKELFAGDGLNAGSAGWRICGVAIKIREMRCRREINGLSTIIKALCVLDTHPSDAFYLLHSISVSSIYSRSSSSEFRRVHIEGDQGKTYNQMMANFEFFIQWSNIKRVCWRSEAGPLSTMFMQIPSESRDYTHIIHSDPDVIIPLPFGMPIIWYDDAGQSLGLGEVSLVDTLRKGLEFRGTVPFQTGAIDLDIYCSIAQVNLNVGLTVRQMEAKVQELLDSVLSEPPETQRNKEDSIRYHLSLTTPTCEICG